MVRESVIERAVKIVRSQRDYRRTVALRAGVDSREVETLIDDRNQQVVNAVLSMAGLGGRIRVVDTQAKKFIEKIIRIAAWDQRFYILWGPTGAGKTFVTKNTIDALRPQIQDPITYVRITEFNKGNIRYFLRDAAFGFKLQDDKDLRWKGYVAYSRLVENFAERRGVVVIDEAHRMKDNLFDGIRDIMDQTKLSIVMLGTTELTSRLDKQFLGRLDDKYEIPDATPGDVKIFLQAYGVEVEPSESKAIAKKITKLRSIDTLNKAMRVIAGSVSEGEFTWKNVGGGQVIEAIERVMMTMKVNEETNGTENK